MAEIYSKFSNYSEINVKNRTKSANEEIELWGADKEVFRKYREEWNKAGNEDYLPMHPLHVDIELSDACNLRCKMCAHGLGTVKNVGLMNQELVKKLIDQCVEARVYSIKFNWRGEPSLNSFLPGAVKYAKEKGILEVQINTNGQTLPNNPDILLNCAANGIDRIIFSVDGFSKETYEQIRIGGSYEKVFQNIHRLIEWKKKNSSHKPFIRIQMVRTKINEKEVDEFIKYWQPLVDDVRISDVTDRGQGNELAVGDQIAVGRRRCPQPFQRLTIGRDGRASPCCSDWYQEFIVGDTAQEKIMDIWNNKKFNAIREIQNTNQQDKIKICKDCYVKESYVWKTVDRGLTSLKNEVNKCKNGD